MNQDTHRHGLTLSLTHTHTENPYRTIEIQSTLSGHVYLGKQLHSGTTSMIRGNQAVCVCVCVRVCVCVCDARGHSRRCVCVCRNAVLHARILRVSLFIYHFRCYLVCVCVCVCVCAACLCV